MPTNHFTQEWNSLTTIQVQAASWDKGPILVLAGPGSGKTRVLTSRIAKILENSLGSNFKVLGLTFTNAAADEMRNRIKTTIPGNENRIFIGTFHSFCAEVIRQHGAHIGINSNFSIYSHNSDLIEILSSAIWNINPDVRLNDKLLNNYLSSIQWFKSNLILPTGNEVKFVKLQPEKQLAEFYKEYEKQLARKNALDFNSLLMRTYELFSRFPYIAKHYRTVYKYICIDEFQDTNISQYEIIKLLIGSELCNIFVVADDDQIIYQWNGAHPKRIKTFIQDFSPKIIQMPMNFRCPYPVVEIANRLIQNNYQRFENRKPLESLKHNTSIPAIQTFFNLVDNNEEFATIVSDIKKYHINDSGSVAILARRRKLLDDLSKFFEEQDLPAVICKRKDDFESTPIVWLISVLQLLSDKENGKILESLCGSFFQLSNIDVPPETIINEANSNGWNFIYAWIRHIEKVDLTSSFLNLVEEIKSLYNGKITHLQFANDAIEWFREISQNQMLNNPDKTELFAGFEEEQEVWKKLTLSIVQTLEWDPSLEAFLQELQIHSKESVPDKNAIRLMTIHGSKGKEFSHVYLIGLVEDELPSFQSIIKGDASPEMEEERRNCFVAITRTKTSLTLSYANKYYGHLKKPSRFLYEMGLIYN